MPVVCGSERASAGLVAELFLRAGRARKLVAEMRIAAFGSEYPGADGPGRIVTEVLGVAAFEVGDPVSLIVLMEGDDFAGGHL